MKKLPAILLTFLFLAGSLPVNAAAMPDPSMDSPIISLQWVIDTLHGQASDLRQALVNLYGLNDAQKQTRQAYLIFLDGVLSYYDSLKVDADGANVKEIAMEIRSRRQESYQLEIKKISDFVLVYQALHILDTAQKRFARIDSDLDRLVDLKILKNGKPDPVMYDARSSLKTAEGLMSQAESLLDNRTQNESLRLLLTNAIAKVRRAYKDFLAISSFVSNEAAK